MARSRVFFITDVHGSSKCFRKFLNAAKFYKADALILGGDITGKVMTPILESHGRFSCSYQGAELTLTSKEEVEQFRRRAAESGTYTHLVNPRELEELEADPDKVKELFNSLMVERVREWVSLAEERLEKTSVKCFISPGNDDVFEIDPVLNSSSYVVNPEERVVEIDREHEMITSGTTNHTPWNTP
ncbi:MAG TPA: hypothetical protein VGS04_04315, partial [Nitrososphaerales archaeon]|nr:hypothetical protein [Nitrososphaerales archaeon]